jgi:hypothetical protein
MPLYNILLRNNMQGLLNISSATRDVILNLQHSDQDNYRSSTFDPGSEPLFTIPKG